jgi:hypothetical protein
LDSIYSTCGFLNPLAEQPDLVNICRVRNNRKFYRKPEHDHPIGEKGHPVWYGNPFHLIDSSTWGTPDDQINTSIKLKNGRQVIVQIKGWNDLLMSGKKNLPMHNYPFKIVKIYVIDLEGQPIFKRPLWLMVIGKRRHEIDLMTIYTSYRQRFDLEHFFRFGKQKLLLTSYQTPEIRHEENWCQIVCLAYILLFLSAPLANNCPRPWERYLPQFREDLNQIVPSPSKVQRDMISVLKQIGTPSSPKKIRGNAPGRKKGTTLPKRERFPIVFKKRKKAKVKPP